MLRLIQLPKWARVYAGACPQILLEEEIENVEKSDPFGGRSDPDRLVFGCTGERRRLPGAALLALRRKSW